jgi:uncharacterized protein YkwD
MGLPDLHAHQVLTAIATAYAKDMEQRGYFGHQSPEGKTVSERLRENGVLFALTGENIAKGQKDASEVLLDWMQSEHHRANILNPRFTRFGIGHSSIVWVQIFAD